MRVRVVRVQSLLLLPCERARFSCVSRFFFRAWFSREGSEKRRKILKKKNTKHFIERERERYTYPTTHLYHDDDVANDDDDNDDNELSKSQ